MRAARAILLVALLAAPLAAAAPPTPVAWGGHETGLRVNALSMGGATLAAGLDIPNVGSSGQSDLVIYDAETGVAKARPYAGTPPPPSVGRNLTAVSGDGLTVASVGNNSAPSPLPGQLAPRLKLDVQRLSGESRWTNTSVEVNTSVLLETGSPVGLRVSHDGTRVVVAYNTATELVVSAFTTNGATITPQYTHRQAGAIRALAATPDLDFAAAAGSIPESNNETHAVLHVIPFSTGAPSRSHFDRSANGTIYGTVGITADASRVVAGDLLGRIHVFAGGNPSTPIPLPGAVAPVSHLQIAEDGGRIAATTGPRLYLLDGTRAPAAFLYNATLVGNATGLAMNRTGGLIAVAGGGQITGFGDLDATPHWRIAAEGPHVAMDADGKQVAYTPTATRVSVATILHGIALEHAAGGDTPTIVPVRPQGTAVFEMVVKNSGSTVERVAFQAPNDLDVTVTFQPPVIAVNPDSTARINVSVTTGPLYSGTRSFNVTAVALTSSVRDDSTLSIALRDDPDVHFLYNDTGDVVMKAGESRTVRIGVQNDGATDAAVGIRPTQSVSQGLTWTVNVDPASLTLAPSSRTTVQVTVTAPSDAKDGTANTLRLTLEGTNVTDEVRIVFRVNPTLGVDVTASGSRVKFVEPGAVASYNVTVTNTGSLPRRFEAFYEVTAQGGKSWAVDMDTSAFRLEPAGTRTVEVRIFAPQDAAPNQDRASVLVRARSVPEQVNETLAEGNVTLFANAVPKAVTTTTPTNDSRVPFTPTLPLLAAAGALALLTRRRRP